MPNLVIVSNRVTVPRTEQRTGQAGGLGVSLATALAEYGGVWFGWDGTVVDEPPAQAGITEHGAVTYATTPLSRIEYDGYYAGFSNGVLWPVCHYMLDRLEFQSAHREVYEATNERFADLLLPLIDEDSLIWVHDYHLVPLARALRRRGIGNTLGFFLHIPFPPYGLLKAMPGWREWLRQLLEYDVIGLQTPNSERACADSLTCGTQAKEVEGGVAISGRRIRLMTNAIGIDAKAIAREAERAVGTRRVRRLHESLGQRDLIVGAERLDYTKGLPNRFEAYGHLLARHKHRHGRTVFVQIASPSRENLGEYEHLRGILESRAGYINGAYADSDWVPLRYIHKTFARSALLGFFRLARVGFVTPLRDGMNLVAKEYVAAQDPEDPGVLVLSDLTGAAAELKAALLVNPFDEEGMGEALEQALSMPRPERRERWHALMEVLHTNSLARWRERFIEALQQSDSSPEEAVNEPASRDGEARAREPLIERGDGGTA